MNTQPTLFGQFRISAQDLAAQAIEAVTEGMIDPIEAYIAVSRMEAAIKRYKEDERVRDITLRELAKYGRSHTFGDCRLEESESGVRYDFSQCGDEKLADMYGMLESLKADIRERETMLKALPADGLADPDTGCMLYPPAKSSKTIIKTTFKNK